MATIEINRRTQLGFGWNSGYSRINGRDVLEAPTKPYLTGTYNTLGTKIQESRELNSMTNTNYTSAHFVKVNGTWKRIVSRNWDLDYRETCKVEVE